MIEGSQDHKNMLILKAGIYAFVSEILEMHLFCKASTKCIVLILQYKISPAVKRTYVTEWCQCFFVYKSILLCSFCAVLYDGALPFKGP